MASQHSLYAPPADATPAAQKKYYRTMIIVSVVACSILSFIVASDLNDLESGAESSVRVWAPVSFIYNQGGYWPAVLSVPVLCLATVAAFLWKIKKINAANTTAG